MTSFTRRHPRLSPPSSRVTSQPRTPSPTWVFLDLWSASKCPPRPAPSPCASSSTSSLFSLERFGQLDSTPCECPATISGCLAAANTGDSPPLDPARHPYTSLVGSLLWATLTRPDVATAVSRACQHSQTPTIAHWRAAIRILRYLATTSTLGLVYLIKLRVPRVTAYVDASYGNETQRRSRYGFAVFLSCCLISWSTKPTTMVCLSTAEAEFVAATHACKDVVWLRNVLREVSFPHPGPAVVFEDNQACVAMIKNHSVSGRNRHFCIKMV